jgi:hypothetical protein
MSKKQRASRFDLEKVDHFRSGLLRVLEGDDRAAAIIGGSFVETALEQVLRSHLCDDKNTMEAMFGPQGYLATFAAKIDMCYALGFVGKQTHTNLKLMKDIRNRFAHSIVELTDDEQLTEVSFSTKPVSSWCDSIRPPFKSSADHPERKKDRRNKFNLMCIHFVVHLLLEGRNPDAKQLGKNLFP